MESKNYESRRIIKIGTSYAITVPAQWIRDCTISKGDTVTARLNEQGELVIKKQE